MPGISFEQWVDMDAQWKADTTALLRQHGEDIAVLKAMKETADDAKSSAGTAKKWAAISSIITAIASAIAIVFGGK